MTGDVLYQPFPMMGRSRAQIWRYAPEFRRPRHFHAEPEMNLVVRGRGTFRTGDKLVATTAGDVLWWMPGQDHELVFASEDFDLFVMALTPEQAERVVGTEAWRADAGAFQFRLSPRTLESLGERCAVPLTQFDPSFSEQHVGELWQELFKLRRSASGRHALTRRALRWMTEHPELARDEISLRARSAPSEVSRSFKRDTGLRPSRYRMHLRLIRFIQTVDGGVHSLMTAALAAGFGSYSQCHRVFRETLGCAPRDFFKGDLRQVIQDAFEPVASGLHPLAAGPSASASTVNRH